MAELFQRDKSTISRHIKNIFIEGELIESATVAYFATVQNEGERVVIRLDMIEQAISRMEEVIIYLEEIGVQEGQTI